jgi:hypothetical protein
MLRKNKVALISIIILIIIIIIISTSIYNFDSGKNLSEQTFTMKIGILFSTLFIASMSNIMADLYVHYFIGSDRQTSMVDIIQ